MRQIHSVLLGLSIPINLLCTNINIENIQAQCSPPIYSSKYKYFKRVSMSFFPFGQMVGEDRGEQKNVTGLQGFAGSR